MLSELRLRDFRCFETLELRPAAGINFIVGQNAQGKTSILEAICMLARLQSPRTRSLKQSIRFGATAASLDGRIRDRHLRFKWGAGGRKIELDSVLQAKSPDYLSVARVSWFSNEDIDLVRGAGGGRRRYLDFLGAQTVPGYLAALRSYERALRSRNYLLKRGRAWKEIEVYDRVLSRFGSLLVQARQEMLLELQPFICEAGALISDRNDEIRCVFFPNTEAFSEEEMLLAFSANREKDERLRQTTTGPQRDDFSLLLAGKSAAEFASEGQQRTISLALRMGQTKLLEKRTGVPPLLLIDDIFGELDRERRNRLLAIFPTAAQTLITTTMLDWRSQNTPAKIFELSEGSLNLKTGVERE
ncbi:MAG: DNA replication/repair protein RecF [Chthoniobacterales bacterium]